MENRRTIEGTNTFNILFLKHTLTEDYKSLTNIHQKVGKNKLHEKWFQKGHITDKAEIAKFKVNTMNNFVSLNLKAILNGQKSCVK